MALVIDNDGIKFLEEFRSLCQKYVSSASALQITFNDGSSCGMLTILKYGLGHITLKECV